MDPLDRRFYLDITLAALLVWAALLHAGGYFA